MINLRMLALAMLLQSGAFAAPLTITFASSLLNGRPGQTVTFSANLTNTTSSNLFLNSDSLNIAAPLVGDDTNFFFNFPALLGPGASSGSFPIFNISIPSGTPFVLNSGKLDILGGTSATQFTTVGSATFAVNVVPEPASSGMLLAGLCAAAILRLSLCKLSGVKI